MTKIFTNRSVNPYFFPDEELATFGITVVGSPDEADVMVFSQAEHLGPYVQQYGDKKRYLVWCDEPLWSFRSQLVDMARIWVSNNQATSTTPASIPVDVMNCFTGDVLFSNLHFLTRGYNISIDVLRRATQRQSFSNKTTGDERKIAALLTYRNDPAWNYGHPSGIKSLNNLRTRIALEGSLFGKVDVFGTGWPLKLALGDDRDFSEESNPWTVKLERYKNYHFALCMENTWAPYYVTEKIWHAIIAGCLPIYFAGPKHTIYQDFPKNSFIDYSEFDDPVELFDFVKNLNSDEFDRRMLLCLNALQSALYRSDEGRIPRKLQVQKLADRLAALRNELNQAPIPIQHYYPSPNWPALLKSSAPVILDIGANDGGTSEFFLGMFPESKIYAFEPDPRALERFHQRLDRIPGGRISLFEGVVAGTDGQIDFHMSDGEAADAKWYDTGWDLSGSIKRPLKHLDQEPTIVFSRVIQVRSTTLDHWADENQLAAADLAWIDVQGAELDVIRNGKALLSKTRYLYMEYADEELYEGQPKMDDLLAELPEFELVSVFQGDMLLRNRQLG